MQPIRNTGKTTTPVRLPPCRFVANQAKQGLTLGPQIARFLGCSHWAATTEGSQPSEQGVAQGGGRLRRV